MNVGPSLLGNNPSFVAKALHLVIVASVGLFLLVALADFVVDLWPSWLGLVGVLIAAHRLHPKVKTRWFFMPGRYRFTGLVLATPTLAWTGLVAVFDAAAGRAGLGLAGGLLALVASAAGGYLILQTFKGKIMGNVFKLVAPTSEGALLSKLHAHDKTHGADGQAADFSRLDPDAVAGAIKDRVIGQNHAVEDVVHTAFRRARLARPNKPVATFLFVGATGAGKTELAKALAHELFDGRVLRVDCNEMSEESSVARLVGSPPGYMGSDQGSQFCREIGRMGSGVLLLDEVEKAHPAVLKVMMGLLDEARITEASTSTTYSARGFLVVLTSNAAHKAIAEVARVEQDPTQRAVKTRGALQQAGFLPEVLGRLDGIFAFAPLTAEDYCRVIEKFLIAFGNEVGVTVVGADADLLLDLVTKAMTTREYGVREVVRSIENTVTDGLLAVRDAGAKEATIKVKDGKVLVLPVGADPVAKAADTQP